MARVKFMVMYPRPTAIDAFEKHYHHEHVPMAVEKLVGKPSLSHPFVTASGRCEYHDDLGADIWIHRAVYLRSSAAH